MRVATPRINWSKGVLSREAALRFDLEAYFQCALVATNAVPLPLGGFDQRGGTRTRARLRRNLRVLSLTSGMVSAPNGGTAANGVDQNSSTEIRTTANANSAATFVVAQVDLGASTTICFADARGFACQTGSADSAFRCQTSPDNTNWTDFGDPMNIRSDKARTRRFSAGAGATRAVRYVRFVVTGQPAIGTVGIKEIRILAETTQRSIVRRFNFTFGPRESYLLVATDRNIDVFRSGIWMAAVPIPHRGDQLEIVTRTQQDDVMLLWHPEVQPHTLFREGAHNEWDSYAQTFSSIPTLPIGTLFGAAQDEVQEVYLTNVQNGDGLQFLIEDCHTALVTKSANAASMVTAIKNAVEALPNVDAGLTVAVYEATANTLGFTIRFSGGANAARSWPFMWVDNHTRGDMGIAVTVLQDGRASSGAIMSNATGWPRCGAFYQKRLIVGGFKQKPASWAGSVVDDFFNFNQPATLTPSSGFDDTLNSDELATIYHIFGGRHLQFFTENSEWYLSDRALSATDTRNVVQATRNGVRPGIEPIQAEGATQFVQGSTDPETGVISGLALRDFLYTDSGTELTYTADSLTLLASHLASDIVDVSYRRASRPKEAHQIFMTNRDGTAAMLVFLRGEKIQAMVPDVTDGRYLAFGVDATRNVFKLVERTANGVTDNWLEQVDAECYLDATERVELTPAAKVVPLPARLEGKTVWAIADGLVLGPYTCTGQQIVLPNPAAVIDVGLFFDWRIETMPLRVVLGNGQVDMSPYRIHTVTATFRSTSSAAIGANGTAPQPVYLRRFGDNLDAPPISAPSSGDYKVEGLEGKVRAPTCVVTRPEPGPITLEGVFMEAA
jgi:hypothetical protein